MGSKEGSSFIVWKFLYPFNVARLRLYIAESQSCNIAYILAKLNDRYRSNSL